MAHKVYDIYTNLDPQQLSELASETFKLWLKFALGQQEIGGKKLLYPSGRYASAISWKRTGVARVSIMADEDAIPEVGAIEYGRPEIDLKSKMLFGGRAHTSKEGYQYRVLPLRPDSWRDTPSLAPGMTLDTMSGGKVRTSVARMWAKPRPFIDKNSRFRTMTNRPGSSPWRIPEFHPYAPGAILADLLDEQFGRHRSGSMA
jgi:hypothetical protein